MNLTIDPTGKKGKIILTGLILLVLVAIVYIAYKIFIQFKDSEVKNYIKVEADKTADPASASKILTQGCQHILSSRTLTNQVLASAKASGVPREQELVHAALMQAYSYGYIEKP